ncbi:iron complex transport system substrate-binding protein [Cohaesibacter sp. ES.047]|uniref:ABC transporter substrate-binding protein n=1 Tax=Cohaesibacter sp. ES.047 TaxID=1798205 RepID=UPI000BB84988|nr:ABC transporter substrate-binding protein [Cohaesibacter sp. ES.047]SNY93164.1 iron complex transport system substrate-binding protein [Cohaesibacter sp. ES.047]
MLLSSLGSGLVRVAFTHGTTTPQLPYVFQSGLSARQIAGAIIAFMVGLFLFLGTALAAPISVTDESDVTVTFAEAVDRIVAFNAYNGEFVRAVAGIETLVGMDGNALKEVGYWPDDGSVAVAGVNQREPDYEAIIGLEPDVVIFPRNGAWQEARDKLATFDIPVLVLTGWDPLRHTANVAAIGDITGHPDRAEKLNAFFTGYQDLLKERLKGVKKRSIYVEHGADYHAPTPGSGWHDMIAEGGGDSILSDIDIAKQPASKGSVHSFVLEPEFILKKDPEVIIKFHQRSYLPASKAAQKVHFDSLLARPGWSDLQAVKNGELYTVNWFASGACSKIIGSLYIAKWLYPDQFEDVDPDEAMRVWLEEFQGVKDPSGYSYHE